MTKEYWMMRKQWYTEMADHLKEQRDRADQKDKQRLIKELERVYNEIGFINDQHLV